MQQLIIPSEEIYPYQFEVNKIDFEQGRRLAGIDYDFTKVPPIPVYEIPEGLRVNSWKYMFPDGNKRWYYGHVTAGRVAAILLEPGEKIKIEEWGMAPFRNANHPRVYEKTLIIYKLQENIG